MIHREKDLANPPSGLMDPKWNDLKARLLTEKNTHEVNTTCYRDSTIDELVSLYKNKCAICERDRGTELQVDHFRPKKTRANKTGIKYNQPGYYWLAYEWSNLIPLCSKCNQKKSNKFPLEGWVETNRIDDHLNTKSISGFNSFNFNWLQNYEKPLMINPEYEITPERHFVFDSRGKIKGRTIQGRETIILCNLNSKDLRRARLEFRQDYVAEIKDAFDEFSVNGDESELKGALKVIFKKIKSFTHKDKPHSLYHTFIYRYFEYFIASKLPSSVKNKAFSYFNDFKAL